MTSIVFTGAKLPGQDILHTLYQHGYQLMLEPHSHHIAQGSHVQSPAVVVLAFSEEATLGRTGHALHRQAIAWIGWNTSDDPALTLAAYAAGARAVLPAAMTAAVLVQSIQRVCSAPAPQRQRTDGTQGMRRRFRRGEPIQLQADDVIAVAEGIVAQTMLHRDGCEVLMGLSGPGQLIVGHPDDACCLELRAHTDAMVVIYAWHDAATQPDFPERLRERIRSMEGWSAMQARPHLDQRILGILSVLAEQFGTPHPHGLLVDVRITHAQLAAAVGATRSTVTRLLSDMRTRGELASVAAGESERYVLCRWEQTSHTHPRRAVYAAAD